MLTVKALSPDKTVMGKADGINGPVGNSSLYERGEYEGPPRGLRPCRASHRDYVVTREIRPSAQKVAHPRTSVRSECPHHVRFCEGPGVTVGWLRSCGTAGKPGGNREDKHQPVPLGEPGLLTKGLTYGYFELSEPLIILLLKQEGKTNNVVDYVE